MANDGKYLERKVREALTQYVKAYQGFMYRFYDTRSAASFLPAQPGDFFLLTPNHCLLIECKSSETGTPLIRLANAKTNTASSQRAKHTLWLRAGHPTTYIYLDLTTNQVEWHEGREVILKNNLPICCGHIEQIYEQLIKVIGFYNECASRPFLIEQPIIQFKDI